MGGDTTRTASRRVRTSFPRLAGPLERSGDNVCMSSRRKWRTQNATAANPLHPYFLPRSLGGVNIVFESFDLQIAYDKGEGRVEISATVSEAVAEAFENAKALLAEGSSMVTTNIAGTGFEPVTSGLGARRAT